MQVDALGRTFITNGSSVMTKPPQPAVSRLNPDASGRFTRSPVKPTKGQSALEYALFGLLALLIGLGGIALYTMYSPRHRSVPNRVAEGLKADRLNLLLIGIGGDTHPGGGKDLADALMMVSLKPSTRQAAVISIPRDLWVKIGSYGTHRINTAHAIGNDSGYPGAGPGLTMDTVSQTFGQPIHAYIRLDFAAFETVIDDLGGIDVFVQRSFYDFLFKDGFARGWQHLTGKRALAYARYRYILGPEGDNFAREMRQQQVINAVRDKLQHRGPDFVLHLISILGTLSNHTQTNLSAPQMVSLYRMFHGLGQDHIRHVSLKPFMEKFDVTTISDAGEAIRPRSGNFAQVQSLAGNVFSAMDQVGTSDEIMITGTSEPAPAAHPALSAVN